MDPSQNPHRPEQVSSESYNTVLSSSQIQASSYTYEPDQSTYAYYPSSYQYAYYDSAQQPVYDYSNAYYQQPLHEPPTSTHPPAAPFPPQPQSDPAAAAAAAAHYQYSYYPPPQPQGVDYGGVYGSGAAVHSGSSTAQVWFFFFFSCIAVEFGCDSIWVFHFKMQNWVWIVMSLMADLNLEYC